MVRAFFGRLSDTFGWTFVALLISAYLGVKGSLMQLTTSAQLPYFKKNLGITGTEYQAYGTAAMTPWAMKALIGTISDAVPLFGYHKRNYILLAALGGSLAYVLLATLHIEPSGAALAAFLLFCAQLELATVDLLVEGTYARMMVLHPETGADLVSAVWGLNMGGSFMASAVVGVIADHFNARVIFWVCLPLAAQIIIPIAAGWLPEPSVSPGVRMDKLAAHPALFRLCLAMAFGALGLAFVSLLATPTTQAVYSITASTVLCVAAHVALPTLLARANLYMFLASAFYVAIPGALDFFYTADEACVPGGPHFDMSFYLSWTALVGSVAGALGVAAFQTFLSRAHFRTAFWTTCMVKVAASLFDLVLIKRWNLRIGIGDKVMFLAGDAIIQQVIGMLDFMPAVVLTSKVCPPGVEATVYALLAGFSNFGSNVSRALGVALIKGFGIRTTVPCDFTRLPQLLLLTHVALPLLTVPLVWFLIPDARMTDNLFGEDAAVEGGGDTTAVDVADGGYAKASTDEDGKGGDDGGAAPRAAVGGAEVALVTAGTAAGVGGGATVAGPSGRRLFPEERERLVSAAQPVETELDSIYGDDSDASFRTPTPAALAHAAAAVDARERHGSTADVGSGPHGDLPTSPSPR